ncbi:hypothetical protein Tco_0162954 [Tanacetum coccineum]
MAGAVHRHLMPDHKKAVDIDRFQDPHFKLHVTEQLRDSRGFVAVAVFRVFARTIGIVMAGENIDNLTMEQYLTLTRGNHAPDVVRPKIRGNVNFEIKSQFMWELRKDTFSGNKNDDAHKHIEQVLDIVSLFNILGVTRDAVMLRVFPITLTGAAKRPLNNLKIFTTSIKREKKHCTRLRKDSHGPIPSMTPVEGLTTIQTMADHSQKWHDGSPSQSICSSNNSIGMAAIVSKLDNLGRDMKKLKENVHAIQVGCQLCDGPHLGKECPLNEDAKSVE